MAARIKGCDCDCASAPADPCESCASAVSYQLQCRSRGGTATLCGFSEYTAPSAPPRKYRTKNFSGTTTGESYQSSGCVNLLNTYSATVGGSYRYDRDTCSESADSTSTGDGSYGPSCVSGFANIVWSSTIAGSSVCSSWPGLAFGGAAEELTRTSRLLRFSTAAGVYGPDCYSPNIRVPGDPLVEQLTDEDTEEDAMERSVSGDWTAWGTGNCTTSKTPRGAGEFTFTFVEAEYRIRVAGPKDALVDIELTFTRLDGAPYTEIRQFVATQATYPVDPETGWQVFSIQAAAGGVTTLASHRIYKP